MSSMVRLRRARRCVAVCAAIAAAVALAPPASAVPASLRSAEDVLDLAETFMRNMVASNVKGAYRVAAPFWPLGMSGLAKRISEAESHRKALRKTIGLSLGSELVASEEAGERVIRISHLERFDEGALIWRFLFYRADMSWQLVSLSQTEDLGVLFSTR